MKFIDVEGEGGVGGEKHKNIIESHGGSDKFYSDTS